MKFAKIFKSEKPETIKKQNGKTTIFLHYAFTDLKGTRYYYYNNAKMDMNPARYATRYVLLVKEYFEGIHKVMVKSFINDIIDGKFKSMAQIQAGAFNLGKYLEFDADLYIVYKIMAILYLTEDEDNLLITDKKIEEKAENIRLAMEASMGADEGFFLCPFFRSFLKSANLLDADFSELLRIQEKVLKTLETTLDLIREKIQ
jgi:hypothetical protein